MNLESIFYLAQSIQAVILSVFFLGLIGLLIYLSVVIRRTSHKLKEVVEEGLETAHDAKRYLNRIGKAAMDYLIIKSVGSIINKRKKRS